MILKPQSFSTLNFVPYNNNNNELQFPTYIIVSILPEWVDDLPRDIHCMKIYEIKCSPREWVQKKPEPEVLQDAFFEKENINMNKEGRKVHQ